jgi:hypothetical protein
MSQNKANAKNGKQMKSTGCWQLQKRAGMGLAGIHLWFLSDQSEQLAHEPDLTSNIIDPEPAPSGSCSSPHNP